MKCVILSNTKLIFAFLLCFQLLTLVITKQENPKVNSMYANKGLGK